MHVVLDSYQGPVVDVFNGVLQQGTPNVPGFQVIVLVGQDFGMVPTKGVPTELGFLVSTSRMDLRVEEARKLGGQVLARAGCQSVDWQSLETSTKDWPDAGLKSLLQKLIRFQPFRMRTLDGKVHDARAALVFVILALLRRPGVFVPNIQRFVTGMEAVSKRLLVAAMEDARVVTSEHMRTGVSLLGSALLAQRARAVWSPDPRLIAKFLEFGLAMQAEPSASVWATTRNLVASKLQVGQPPLKTVAAMLNILRSFASDIALVEDLATDIDPSKRAYTSLFGPTRPQVMNIEHAVDHHWAPNFVLFNNLYTALNTQPSNPPFKQLMQAVWDRSSSLNPRKQVVPSQGIESSLVSTRQAQRAYLLALRGLERPRKVVAGLPSKRLEYKLHDDWLAGMLGVVLVPRGKVFKNQPPAMVALKLSAPRELVVGVQPSRDTETPELLDDQKASIEAWASKLLANQVALKGCLPCSSFKNAKLLRREEEPHDLFIKFADKPELVPWDQARNLDFEFDQLEEEADPTCAWSCGIERKASKKFKAMLKATPPRVLSRVLYYLAGFPLCVKMVSISRDGGGTHLAAVKEDAMAFSFFLRLARFYPAGLRCRKGVPCCFDVPNGPLLWTLRDKIREALSLGSTTEAWPLELRDARKRHAWPHQTSAVDEMVQAYSSGRRGSFLWIPVRMGKTFIVMSFLAWLSKEGNLPPCVIYTLPPSAMTSVAQEVLAFGFEVDVLVPTKDAKTRNQVLNTKTNTTCVPRKFCISLVEHDHLRLCADQLVSASFNSLVVVDEVHHTLHDTQRTSNALQLAMLAKCFVVLTGTPVVDSKTYKLLGWLRGTTNIALDERNFFVAAMSMVTRHVKSNKIRDYKEVLASFTPKEAKEYFALVPSALGGTNSNPVLESWQRATQLSYDAATRVMAEQVAELAYTCGVAVVARDKAHQERLVELIKSKGVDPSDVFTMDGKHSIDLTDASVEAGQVHDFRVVVTTQKRAEGYSLARLGAMVTSVYPSNQATREQMLGRIDGPAEKRDTLIYRMVHVGSLTALLKSHNHARSLQEALKSLANSVA